MSADARASRKQAQLARIEKKGDPDYPLLYAKQPHEIKVAAEQGAQRKAIRAAKVALEIAMQADARGATEIFTGAPAGPVAAAADDSGSMGT
jgi:hypothetical protein